MVYPAQIVHSTEILAVALLGNQVYGPYGTSLYSAGQMDTTKGYTGQYGDTLTGLDYYVSRWYDPVVSVFLSADVKEGNPQGLNPYAYVGGNPETETDPSGQYFAPPGGGSGGNGNPNPPSCTRLNDCNSGNSNYPTLPPPTTPPLPDHGPTPCPPQACGSSTSFSTNTGTIQLAGVVLTPALIKLAQNLIQNNERLNGDFGSSTWTVISVKRGTDVVNNDGVYTQRWYFTMDDGDGSKVVLSLNFNPTLGAKDPWDMQHVHFSSDAYQPDPDKWGTKGYARNTDWYDPGSSENPGAENDMSSFAQAMFEFEQNMSELEDASLIDDATD